MRYRVILQQTVYRVVEIAPGAVVDARELCDVAAAAWRAQGYQPDLRDDPLVLWVGEVDPRER